MIFVIIPKLYALLIFVIALCKISRLMKNLKQFGVVNNACVLRFHVIFMTLDSITCFGVIIFSYYEIVINYNNSVA